MNEHPQFLKYRDVEVECRPSDDDRPDGDVERRGEWLRGIAAVEFGTQGDDDYEPTELDTLATVIVRITDKRLSDVESYRFPADLGVNADGTVPGVRLL